MQNAPMPLNKLCTDLRAYVLDISKYVKLCVISEWPKVKVYLAKDKQTGDRVAIKEMVNEESEDLSERISNEIRIMAKCKHQFLISLLGFSATLPYRIVMEYMPKQSLFDMLYNGAYKLTGTQKTRIAIGIAAGMAHLHELNIVHGDLKSRNILIDDDFMPKISDFGNSRIIESRAELRLPRRGSPAWSAPEIFCGGVCTNSVDIYSYGMVLYEMAAGMIPFKGSSPSEVLDLVVRCHKKPQLPAGVPSPLKKLIESCWSHNPRERPSFTRILELFQSQTIVFEDTEISEIRDLLSGVSSGNELKEEPVSDINSGNFEEFLTTVMNTMGGSEDVVYSALANLRTVITANEDCLAMFCDGLDYTVFRYDTDKLRDVSLSLFIPVLQRFPHLASARYIEFLKEILYQSPVKVLRLFSVLVESYDNTYADMEVCNAVLSNAQLFMEHGAVKPLVALVCRMIRYDAFKKMKYNELVEFFSDLITNRESDVAMAAASSLVMLKPETLPIRCNVLVDLLNNQKLCDRVIRMLCVSKPCDYVSWDLFKVLIDHQVSNPLSECAIMSLCEPDMWVMFLDNIDYWIMKEYVSVTLQIQIVVGIMMNESNRSRLVDHDKLALLFEKAVEYRDVGMLHAMCTIFRKLAMHRSFVERLEGKSVIEKYLMSIKAVNTEDVFVLGYIVIDSLCKTHFMEDYLAFIPCAMEHLRTRSTLLHNAIMYLTLVAKSAHGVQKMVECGVTALLEEIKPDLSKDMLCWANIALRNIEIGRKRCFNL